MLKCCRFGVSALCNQLYRQVYTGLEQFYKITLICLEPILIVAKNADI